MKQHITVEQLWELTDNKDNWQPIIDFNTKANIYFPGGIVTYPTFNSCCKETAKQVTIGKMIEIINKDYIFDIYKDLKTKDWIARKRNLNGVIVGYFSEIELCDVLWNATKNILR